MTLQKEQRVRFIGTPMSDGMHMKHYTMALDYIDRGKIYVVEHFFEGDPSQIELKGIDSVLFMSEMFTVVE